MQTTKYIAMLAILSALTTVATLVFLVPYPSTQGYFNLGDVMVMISGLLLGPVGGFIAGGGGSAIADLIAGPVFAPITLISKGCEGFLVGLCSQRARKASRLTLWDVLGVILGSLAMLTGYLLGEMYILGISYAVAFGELITINSIQVIVGSVVTVSIGPVLRKTFREILTDVDETPLELET